MDFSKLKNRFGSIYEEITELPPKMIDAIETVSFSKLDWLVEFQDISTKLQTIPDYRAVVRKDTGKYLGTVGNVYKITQNVDAYKFFDSIRAKHSMTYKYAGSLENDRFICITAVRPGIIQSGSSIYGDYDGYFTIINSHDGRTSLTIIFHLVHRNTNSIISIPKSICADRIRFPHSSKQISGANTFVCDIEISCQKIKQYMQVAASTACGFADMDTFLRTAIPRKNISRALTGDAIKKSIIEIYNKTTGFSHLDLLLSSIIWTTHYRDYSKCRSRISSLIINGRALDMNRRFTSAFAEMIQALSMFNV